MGPYVVLMFKGYSDMKIINKLYTHNERTNNNRLSNKNIDSSRTWRNYHIKECSGRYSDEIEKFVAKAGKVGSRANLLVDGLVCLSPEWFEGKTEQMQRDMFEHAYRYTVLIFGEDNIIDAVVHMDETTPHMHFEAVPFRDGKISQQAFLPFPDGLKNVTDGFYYFMKEKYPEFEKPVPASKTKRKHVSITMYKTCPDFFNMHNHMYEIVKSINILNISAKKDEIMNLYTGISKVAAETILRNSSYISFMNGSKLPELEKNLDSARSRIKMLENENMVLSGDADSMKKIINSLRSDLEKTDELLSRNKEYRSELQLLRQAIKKSGEKNFEEIIGEYNKMQQTKPSRTKIKQICRS